MVAKITPQIAEHEGYKFGFNDNDNAVYKYRTEKGLSEDIVREISRVKDEPQWMTDLRVKAYHHFLERPMPTGFWGGSIRVAPPRRWSVQSDGREASGEDSVQARAFAEMDGTEGGSAG